MTIGEHLTQFGGLQVQQWEPGQPLGDTATTIHRIAVDYDDETAWTDKFRAFLALSGVEQSQGLVVGLWTDENMDGDSAPMIEALTAAHMHLPNLKTLFIGDITYEENEVSWITQGDLSPVLSAYPHLTHLGIRGGNELSLGQLHLPELRELIVQAGGLSAEVVREVMNATLPRLEHLELYLGEENYGATSAADDLTPLLDGSRFPALTYLGLKNSDHQDEIAQMFAHAPILEQLDVLDLSLGTLTDEGAAALLDSDRVKTLKKLNLTHHFCTEGMMEKLNALPIEVDTSDHQDDEDDWRFVALGE
ncbi:STM4015 family protein [Deinococcus arenicola]|uniref:STM4015 family protein n=1 Tax=Deinococcus arenicola TaxID=2994950 RepID=A0ABU4DLV7_9DEIO|nr:STM4015 family protein [Deinococcus sp. ZS9-10]MDV6373413.1 STM4015 family protein [Deinococcus sp. ZS9-10]